MPQRNEIERLSTCELGQSASSTSSTNAPFHIQSAGLGIPSGDISRELPDNAQLSICITKSYWLSRATLPHFSILPLIDQRIGNFKICFHQQKPPCSKPLPATLEKNTRAFENERLASPLPMALLSVVPFPLPSSQRIWRVSNKRFLRLREIS